MAKRKVETVAEAVLLVRVVQEKIRVHYAKMADTVLKHGLPTVFLLQYNPRITHFVQFKMKQEVAEVLLSVIIDSIVSVVAETGCPMLDLRSVMTEAKDWANPIETFPIFRAE